MAFWEIRLGDCVEQMAAMEAESVDAVVCDPPYGIGFMGHEWDQPGDHGPVSAHGGQVELQQGKRRRTQPNTTVSFGGDPHPAMEAGRYDLTPTANRRFQAWCEAWAREAYRVLKPGGHMLVCGGTRTYHRMASGIEDAGFEIRDCLTWLYGSGFPKSLDVGKAIDKAAGAERAIVGDKLDQPGYHLHGHDGGEAFGHGLSSSTPETRASAAAITAPATSEAERWDGWGTALKPGHEPIVVARKPLAGTVAQNVLEHGTGGLNIDACRVGFQGEADRDSAKVGGRVTSTANAGGAPNVDSAARQEFEQHLGSGRWPANVVLDDEAADQLDAQTGELTSGANPTRRSSDKFRTAYGDFEGQRECEPARGTESGGASRFFYVAKAGRAERNAGLVSCRCETFTPSVNEAPSPGTPADSDTPPPRATTEPTSKGEPGSSTTGSGSSSTDRSPTASKSTTSTATSRTTASRTSGSSTPSPTSASTHRTTESEPANGNDGAPSASNGSPQPSSTSTSAPKAGSSTADADPATSASSSSQSGVGDLHCPECGGVRGGHPTVKPIALMRWLVRLVTPPGGTVLDPFTGSGTTGCACLVEGLNFIGCEREAEYVAIANARMAYWADPAKAEAALAIEQATEERRARETETGALALFDEGEAA